MLINSSESHLISNLGWLDKGNLWLCETASARVSAFTISDADYLTLHPGEEDAFVVVHNYTATERLEISAHNISSPQEELSRITFIAGLADFSGDPQVWLKLPRAYVIGANYLLLLDPCKQTAELRELAWFNDSYDHAVQGIVGVTEVPGKALVVISIQRDSEPVLYCPEEDQVIRKIALAGRSGSPVFRFRDSGKEVWVNDYDMLLRLNPEDWSIRDKTRLQWAPPGIDRFIGDFAFNKDESLCAVARPFSGDAVALDTTTFKVTHEASLGQQPFDVSLLSDARVLARDWQSGQLVKGSLKPRRRWWLF
jgi:hypothetical protein